MHLFSNLHLVLADIQIQEGREEQGWVFSSGWEQDDDLRVVL